MSQDKRNEGVRFVRINGRVVPIRPKKEAAPKPVNTYGSFKLGVASGAMAAAGGITNYAARAFRSNKLAFLGNSLEASALLGGVLNFAGAVGKTSAAESGRKTETFAKNWLLGAGGSIVGGASVIGLGAAALGTAVGVTKAGGALSKLKKYYRRSHLRVVK